LNDPVNAAPSRLVKMSTTTEAGATARIDTALAPPESTWGRADRGLTSNRNAIRSRLTGQDQQEKRMEKAIVLSPFSCFSPAMSHGQAQPQFAI
jgi:hypothetical protein